METEQTLILTITDRSILKLLYENSFSPISLYQLHIDYSYSPAQLGSFVAKLSGLGIVDEKDENIQITEFGKRWLLAHRIEIFCTKVEYDWLEVPPEMRKPTISINSLYAPIRQELGESFVADVLSRTKNKY